MASKISRPINFTIYEIKKNKCIEHTKRLKTILIKKIMMCKEIVILNIINKMMLSLLYMLL